MFLSIVIPSYRRPELILRLLADLYAQEGAEFEVIVVDDCSPDDSVEQFKRAFPQAKVLRNEKNGGPAVARNRGIREARGEVIVGFDSDVTVPDRHLLAKVVRAFAEHPKASGFAFRLLEPDGVTDDKPRWWHSQPFETGKDRFFETSYFSGTAYAFRKPILVEAGLYPEWLYMHYEEYLLALRIMDAGGSIFYHPELTAIHHAHPVSRRSQIKTFYKPRNQILLAVDCLPTGRAIAYIVPRAVYSFIGAVFRRSLPDYFRAASSCRQMLMARTTDRKPLSTETLRRVRSLKRA
ncbi:MAG: glycosyltransferase family 2 protein [Opitutaceae bacterium]|nr:glycosyltransferase family 2 protein [Opitutaceae bacterium]